MERDPEPMARLTNWHPEDIKAAVRRRGVTLSSLAGADLTDAAIRASIRRPVPRANRRIADFLGVPLHALWPEWFRPDGERRTKRRNPTKREIDAQRQKGRAA